MPGPGKVKACKSARLKGKDVEIKGTIKEYRGKPEIVLEETNQLVAVGGRVEQKEKQAET